MTVQIQFPHSGSDLLTVIPGKLLLTDPAVIAAAAAARRKAADDLQAAVAKKRTQLEQPHRQPRDTRGMESDLAAVEARLTVARRDVPAALAATQAALDKGRDAAKEFTALDAAREVVNRLTHEANDLRGQIADAKANPLAGDSPLPPEVGAELTPLLVAEVNAAYDGLAQARQRVEAELTEFLTGRVAELARIAGGLEKVADLRRELSRKAEAAERLKATCMV